LPLVQELQPGPDISLKERLCPAELPEAVVEDEQCPPWVTLLGRKAPCLVKDGGKRSDLRRENRPVLARVDADVKSPRGKFPAFRAGEGGKERIADIQTRAREQAHGALLSLLGHSSIQGARLFGSTTNCSRRCDDLRPAQGAFVLNAAEALENGFI